MSTYERESVEQLIERKAIYALLLSMHQHLDKIAHADVRPGHVDYMSKEDMAKHAQWAACCLQELSAKLGY